MNKKTFTLVTTIIGSVGAIASAIVTYIQPSYASAIVVSIGIASTAAIDICGQFVKD